MNSLSAKQHENFRKLVYSYTVQDFEDWLTSIEGDIGKNYTLVNCGVIC